MFSSFKKILQAKSYKQETCRGFSLLELIVVMAIFLIITAVVIADIPNFRQKSSLDLTANEVATYIRGGQVFGISQKGESSNMVFILKKIILISSYFLEILTILLLLLKGMK